MNEIVLRPWTPGDRPGLKELWRVAFGDSDSFIESFYSAFLREGNCLVAEADGRPVSAMYVIPGFEVRPFRDRALTAAYTYALATLPEYRGRGIGSRVYQAAQERALALSQVGCVVPAEPGLFPFYENAAGVTVLGSRREARLPAEALEGIAPAGAVRFPGYRYAGVRELYLSRMPHAVAPEELYDLMEENGVEFFMLENGAAAVENGNGICRILELLSPDADPMAAAAGIARWCRAKEYIVRSPAFHDGPGEERPCLLAAPREAPNFPLPHDLWWGFELD